MNMLEFLVFKMLRFTLKPGIFALIYFGGYRNSGAINVSKRWHFGMPSFSQLNSRNYNLLECTFSVQGVLQGQGMISLQ